MFGAWRRHAQQEGITADPFGWSIIEGEVHPRVKLRFSPEKSETARQLLADLADRWGVRIRDIRDLEHERWWPELGR
ncbi:MAG: hypothetical protein JJU45_02770 [Acidimicrobiia bacterium]|nr:hypothetical protein [Acidimicrobiia bacterium]